MARSSFFLGCAAVLMLACAVGSAQQDREGSKDYPLFSRMPNFYIDTYKEMEFNAVEMPVKEGAKQNSRSFEGRSFEIAFYQKENTPPVSALQIVRNFQNAAQRLNGQILFYENYDSGNHVETTLHVTRDGKEAWVFIDARSDHYTLTAVEKQAMRQDVVANAAALANDIHSAGKVAIYGIYFDTAKSDLKPESDAAIAEIGKLLRQQPTLKVFVVGHTDMVGDASANLKLSQARAQAVINALVAKHNIAAARLTAFGAGPYAPVAPNRDEDGRAKNRRVELVEIATR